MTVLCSLLDSIPTIDGAIPTRPSRFTVIPAVQARVGQAIYCRDKMANLLVFVILSFFYTLTLRGRK